MNVSFEIPRDIGQQVRGQGVDLNGEVREAFLVELYRQDRITHGQLQRALGLDAYETDGVLKRHGVELEVTRRGATATRPSPCGTRGRDDRRVGRDAASNLVLVMRRTRRIRIRTLLALVALPRPSSAGNATGSVSLGRQAMSQPRGGLLGRGSGRSPSPPCARRAGGPTVAAGSFVTARSALVRARRPAEPTNADERSRGRRYILVRPRPAGSIRLQSTTVGRVRAQAAPAPPRCSGGSHRPIPGATAPLSRLSCRVGA